MGETLRVSCSKTRCANFNFFFSLIFFEPTEWTLLKGMTAQSIVLFRIFIFVCTYSLGDIQYDLQEAAEVRARLVRMYESVDIIR